TLVSTVKYGGQSLTRINGVVVNGQDRVELWYLNETGIGAATNTTFAVTYGAGIPTNQLFASVAYKNVDQVAPIFGSNINSINSATPNPLPTTVSVSADGMAVGAEVSGDTGSFTWNNGWSEGTDQQGSSSSATTADHAVAANGTDSASATSNNQHRVAVVAA